MQCIKCRKMPLKGLSQNSVTLVFCFGLLLSLKASVLGTNNRNTFIEKYFPDHVEAKEILKCTQLKTKSSEKKITNGGEKP